MLSNDPEDYIVIYFLNLFTSIANEELHNLAQYFEEWFINAESKEIILKYFAKLFDIKKANIDFIFSYYLFLFNYQIKSGACHFPFPMCFTVVYCWP